MKIILIIQIIILFTFNGCKKQEDDCLPVTTQSSLNGNWNNAFNELSEYGGKNHFITFYKDSFKIKIITVSDLVLVQCNYINSWSEYIKGSFSFNNNSLILNGFFCDENYNKLNYTYCPNVIDIGSFDLEYDKIYYCNDTLILKNSKTTSWKSLLKLLKE